MSDAKFEHTYKTLADAFLIFARYLPNFANVASEHDILYAGPEPDRVSVEDKAELKRLGWDVDERENCFYYFT